jgi:ribose 5-phosphate isomerase B
MDQNAIPVALGCDHAGFPLKAAVAAVLERAGFAVRDCGTDGLGRVDYPDFAHAVCRAVSSGDASFGVLICGSGVGMSIAANRHAGIRCVLAADATTARLSRAHNDANVLALGARLTGEEQATDILRAFIDTDYEGGRHDQRLAKLAPL